VTFQRAYRLTIGTVDIDARAGVGLNALRIAFSVERDAKRVPNNAEVAIWNLAESTRLGLAKLVNVPVRLEAGYVEDVGVIFHGDLRTARSRREGPDIVTRVSGGDGESKIKTARINRTFAAGTPIGTVLRELGKALGVGEGNLRQFFGAKLANGSNKLTRALTLRGTVYDELESITRSCGLSWSVQDSALQIRETGQPVGDRRGPLLRPDTGLIGEVAVETKTFQRPLYQTAYGPPTASGSTAGNARRRIGTTTEQKVQVSGSCLLRHDLIPGVPFRVESEAFTGNLVCRATAAQGDSHSTDQWRIDWVGRPYK
jgi:hypothetical protein